jgi:hypothetical protein
MCLLSAQPRLQEGVDLEDSIHAHDEFNQDEREDWSDDD